VAVFKDVMGMIGLLWLAMDVLVLLCISVMELSIFMDLVQQALEVLVQVGTMPVHPDFVLLIV